MVVIIIDNAFLLLPQLLEVYY